MAKLNEKNGETEQLLILEIIERDKELATKTEDALLGILGTVIIAGLGALAQQPLMEQYIAKEKLEEWAKYLYGGSGGVAVLTMAIGATASAVAKKIRTAKDNLSEIIEKQLANNPKIIEVLSVAFRKKMAKKFKKDYGVSQKQAEEMAEGSFSIGLLDDDIAQLADDEVEKRVKQRKEELGFEGRTR